MPVTFTCPECHKVLRTAASIPAGTRVKCPQCQSIFSVAVDGTAPAAAIPEEGDTKLPADKKANRGSPMLGILIGGIVIVLVVGLALAALVWPGFLRGPAAADEAPRENLLAFLPAKSDIVFGADLTALNKNPQVAELFEQFVKNLSGNGSDRTKAPEGLLDALGNAEKIVVGGEQSRGPIFIVQTKSAFDAEKMRISFNAGPPRIVEGKKYYRAQNYYLGQNASYLGLPTNRILLWSDAGESDLLAALSSDGMTPLLAADLHSQIGTVNSKPAWAALAFTGRTRQGLQQARLSKEMAPLLPPLQRAKTASAWVDYANNDLLINLALNCGTDADAQQLESSLKKTWNVQVKSYFNLVRLVEAFRKDGKQVMTGLTNDLTKTFQVKSQGTMVSASVQLSEKTLEDLRILLANQAPPAKDPRDFPGGKFVIPPGFPAPGKGGLPMPPGGFPGGPGKLPMPGPGGGAAPPGVTLKQE